LQKVITDDLDALLDILPPYIRQPLCQRSDNSELLEVVLLIRLNENWGLLPKRPGMLSQAGKEI